jgi:hypothetical protein
LCAACVGRYAATALHHLIFPTDARNKEGKNKKNASSRGEKVLIQEK